MLLVPTLEMNQRQGTLLRRLVYYEEGATPSIGDIQMGDFDYYTLRP